MKFLGIIIMIFLLSGCVSKSEKAKNTIPYKYRTPEQVKMACENQMKKNSNNNFTLSKRYNSLL